MTQMFPEKQFFKTLKLIPLLDPEKKGNNIKIN